MRELDSSSTHWRSRFGTPKARASVSNADPGGRGARPQFGFSTIGPRAARGPGGKVETCTRPSPFDPRTLERCRTPSARDPSGARRSPGCDNPFGPDRGEPDEHRRWTERTRRIAEQRTGRSQAGRGRHPRGRRRSLQGVLRRPRLEARRRPLLRQRLPGRAIHATGIAVFCAARHPRCFKSLRMEIAKIPPPMQPMHA